MVRKTEKGAGMVKIEIFDYGFKIIIGISV